MNKHYEILKATFADWIVDDLDDEVNYGTNKQENNDIINDFSNLYAVAQAFNNKHDEKYIDDAHNCYIRGKMKTAESLLLLWCQNESQILSGKYVDELKQ